MQGEAAPARRAAATGCPARLPRRATLQRAWPALGHAPPAHLREFVAEEKLGPERQFVTIFEVGVQFLGPGMCSEDPFRGARPSRASFGWRNPARFAIDRFGRGVFAATVFHSAARGDPRHAAHASSQPPGCPRDRPWQAAH